jgi:hypothetical protein
VSVHGFLALCLYSDFISIGRCAVARLISALVFKVWYALQHADPVGQGGEAWIGYKQDLRPCQLGLLLSIEPSFSVFYEGKPVADFCQAVLTRGRQEWQWTSDRLRPDEQRICSKEIKHLWVFTAFSPHEIFMLRTCHRLFGMASS